MLRLTAWRIYKFKFINKKVDKNLSGVENGVIAGEQVFVSCCTVNLS